MWTYTYDLDNQLISANKTGSSNSLAYDGAGRLRQTTLAGTITGLTYDGVDLVAEYNSGGTLLRRYVHGPGVDEPLVWYEGTTTTNKTWLYQDQLGSVIGTANSAGTSTAIHSYGPYGEPNIATGIRFRYTGQPVLGSLNLYYYKARFYSPALGRFLQTDPIGIADDLNLYAYVGNNPINFNDPSGLSAAAASMLLGKLGSWGRENAGTLTEIGIGFTPAGFYTDLYSAVAGRTPITGDSLSGWERVAILIPGVSEIRNAGRIGSSIQGVAESTIKQVNPTNLIPTQTRSEMSGSQIKRLEKDMRTNGFDQNKPIDAVRRTDGRLEIQDGHHRVEAAKRAGIDQIPVQIWEK